MYHLLESQHSYNIFCDKTLDTTGAYTKLELCFTHFNCIIEPRYCSLNHFMEATGYKKHICEFSTSDITEFQAQFPELFI